MVRNGLFCAVGNLVGLKMAPELRILSCVVLSLIFCKFYAWPVVGNGRPHKRHEIPETTKSPSTKIRFLFPWNFSAVIPFLKKRSTAESTDALNWFFSRAAFSMRFCVRSHADPIFKNVLMALIPSLGVISNNNSLNDFGPRCLFLIPFGRPIFLLLGFIFIINGARKKERYHWLSRQIL